MITVHADDIAPNADSKIEQFSWLPVFLNNVLFNNF